VTFPPGPAAGPGRPLLETAASAAISAARQRIGGPRFPLPPVPPLSDEERAEALDVIAKGGSCALCGGIHAAADHGCPRLASFELDGDGNIRAGTFWPDGQYDTSRVVYADPAGEKDADGR
jgi:hypothetical protein